MVATWRDPRTARAALPIVRLMRDALTEARRGTAPWSEYEGVTAPDLAAAVDLHKIGPSVYVHLQSAHRAPADVLAQMRRRHQAQRLRQMQVRADLAEIAHTLTATGMQWVVAKGPALAALWGRPDLRQYADLDVVVDRTQFGEVLDALTASGAQMVDRNWELIREQVRGEVSLALQHGTSLDLHWHVVNDRQLRTYFRFPMEEMLARATTVRVGDLEVPTFDPADTLLHVAYHTAHSGGHRLLWMKDIERTAAQPNLSWELVLQRARAYRVDAVLGMVLARTRDVLGFESTCPPAEAFGRASQTWRIVSTAWERLRPAPVLPGDRSSGQIFFKSARPSVSATWMAAVRFARNRHLLSPDPINIPLHVDRGGSAARDSYLSLIRTTRLP